MKKLLLTLLTLMVSIAMNAERVSKQEALQKAQEFMPNKQFGEAKAFARGESVSPAEYEAFYIFNAEEKKGFVIVSGDDRTEPILGYSDRGNLNIDSIPDNVKWLLGYYEKALTAIAADKSYTCPAKTRGEEKAAVEPMLYTLWSQGEPFNVKCPLIDDDRCVTGCVATAMAQVINYHQWPKGATAKVPAYTTTTANIAMPELEPTTFGWEGHLTTKDLANLLLYCGQSVQMDYGPDGSGAFPGLVSDALRNVFGYDEIVRYVARDEYTDEEWDNVIYGELVAKRPVIYSGFDPTGQDGHSFVLDGYESKRYHINWGWGGRRADGYFLLTGLCLGNSNFNYYQNAVIGIQPPDGTSQSGTSYPKAKTTTPIHLGTKYLWRQSDGKFPAIGLCYYVMSNTKKEETLQIGFGLYNKDGLIKVYEQEEKTLTTEPLEAYPHYANIIISEDLPDGDYWLFPVSRSNNDETWIVNLPDWGSFLGLTSDFYTEFTISNDLLRLYVDDQNSSSTTFDRDFRGFMFDDAGVSYELWKSKGNNYATVMPSQSGGYSGDVYIPDAVTFEGEDYSVYEADRSAFSYCQDLVSLSTSMYEGPEVVGCPKLTNLELREGVTNYTGEIVSCEMLESIVYPKSLSIISHFPITCCNNLKSIKFESPKEFTFNESPLWDSGRLPSLKDIYFSSTSPPNINYMEEEYEVNTNATVHIPCGYMSAYLNSVWKDWNLIDDIIESNKSDITWGYNIGDNHAPVALGIECKGIFETAIHVPSDMIQPYIGKKITGIEFYFEGGRLYWPDYIFVTKPGTEEYVAKELAGKIRDAGWQTISFSESYTIMGDELFVGLGRKEALGIPYSTLDYITDGNWGRQLEGGYETDGIWKNIPDTNPLTLRFIIEGEDLPKDVKLCYPKVNNGKIEVLAVNRCTDLLTSYTVNWDFDGKVNGTKTIETRLASGLAETLAVDIPMGLTGYYNTLTIDVVSVNGEEDAIPANSHVVYDFKSSVDAHYPRTMVMENFVATWCGWSPRGYAAIEKLYDKYPNNFISIGIHEEDYLGDPINYETLIKKYTSTPTFLFNRTNHIDSTLEDATATMEEQKDNADAIVSANAVFASEDKTSVTVKTATTFGFTDDGNADFRIAYVVVEDKVGPYLQGNNYSNPSAEDNPDDYMNEWYKKDYQVEMLYNDVARGIYPDLNGTDGSVPTSVVAGQPYEYEYTFDLPDNIQDKKNIRIVTLLIDNKSGEIMNADQTKVFTETDKDGDANNDNEVDDKDVEAVVRYIMNGDIKGFNAKNAHGSDNGKVTVADIVRILNMIKANQQ